MSPDLPLLTRLWFGWVCFFRVMFRGEFAGRVWRMVHEGESPGLREALPDPSPAMARLERPSSEAALQLLALFQREGRLVDFLEQDVASFSDADIGAAARVVHEGCRRALRSHATLAPVRTEEEGSHVTITKDIPAEEIKLTGRVEGLPPYSGILRHRGWRMTGLVLPSAVRASDGSVLAPAEVEL